MVHSRVVVIFYMTSDEQKYPRNLSRILRLNYIYQRVTSDEQDISKIISEKSASELHFFKKEDSAQNMCLCETRSSSNKLVTQV